MMCDRHHIIWPPEMTKLWLLLIPLKKVAPFQILHQVILIAIWLWQKNGFMATLWIFIGQVSAVELFPAESKVKWQQGKVNSKVKWQCLQHKTPDEKKLIVMIFNDHNHDDHYNHQTYKGLLETLIPQSTDSVTRFSGKAFKAVCTEGQRPSEASIHLPRPYSGPTCTRVQRPKWPQRP